MLKHIQDDIKIKRYVYRFNLYLTFIQKFLVLQKGAITSRISFNLTFWSILANLLGRSMPLETELTSMKDYFMSVHLISHTYAVSKTSSSKNMQVENKFLIEMTFFANTSSQS